MPVSHYRTREAIRKWKYMANIALDMPVANLPGFDDHLRFASDNADVK